jgi:hypothetical protein
VLGSPAPRIRRRVQLNSPSLPVPAAEIGCVALGKTGLLCALLCHMRPRYGIDIIHGCVWPGAPPGSPPAFRPAVLYSKSPRDTSESDALIPSCGASLLLCTCSSACIMALPDAHRTMQPAVAHRLGQKDGCDPIDMQPQQRRT